MITAHPCVVKADLLTGDDKTKYWWTISN